jgi:hypothetical protein
MSAVLPDCRAECVVAVLLEGVPAWSLSWSGEVSFRAVEDLAVQCRVLVRWKTAVRTSSPEPWM